jgi:hypothetical protein
VTIKGKPFLMNQLELDVLKREKHHEPYHEEKPAREAVVHHTPPETVPAEVVAAEAVEAAGEGGEKKRVPAAGKRVTLKPLLWRLLSRPQSRQERSSRWSRHCREPAGEVHTADETAEQARRNGAGATAGNPLMRRCGRGSAKSVKVKRR